MSAPHEPLSGESPLNADPEQPRYEPPPSVGKLLLWVLLFVLAAVVVVVGGVYFS
ncbi:hypothetical protein [Streptomyces sp. NBC_01236]|uniref:hypothetical protein n=1 Tax=Streptomyces sp. NBC_01236 TaxID=2903789 RepID=UPI002E141131|nr:hypothetical protein OG324_18925 [Streptomyces sp. NBC_01236]